MPEIAAYVLGEILCYALFYKTSRILVPILTMNRVRVDEWDFEGDLINHNKSRFSCTAHANGPYVLDCGWGILFGFVFWVSMLTGIGVIYL